MIRRARSALATLAIVLFPVALLAQPIFTWTDLGGISGTGVNTYANAINDAGQVTGQSRVSDPGSIFHGFLYTPGPTPTIADLGNLGGNPSIGLAINNGGTVVGTSVTSGGAINAFRPGGSPPNLGTLPGGTLSEAYGINSSGVITGVSSTSGASTLRAYIYSGTTMTAVNTLGGSENRAFGINASGQITGSSRITGNATVHAFVTIGGTATDIQTLAGLGSVGFALNDSGAVTGKLDVDATHSHAFLYSGGFMTDLQTLGGATSAGLAINAAGDVVGKSLFDPEGEILEEHAFLYTGGTMYDLNDRLYDPYDIFDFVLTDARGINSSGQIIANAVVDGSSHAFLLTPLVAIPEPATYAFALGALTLLVVAVRRRRASAAA